MQSSRGKQICLAVAALVVLAALPFLGRPVIGLEAVMEQGGLDAEIFWNIRMPRLALSFLAGASLALSGMAFQSLFRNPLATPFTLGVSSGASLGAAVCIQLGVTLSVLGIPAASICGFAGALLSIWLVYTIASRVRGFSTATMLLAGVAISLSFASLILFVQYISDFHGSVKIMRWLMGSLTTVGMDPVLTILPFCVVGSLVILYLSNELNLLTVGDELAASRGVDVVRTQKLIFFATSFLVGAVVSICGPIGFVGLMVPHICRLIVGADHRVLAPFSFVFGGVFLSLCDLVARSVIPTAELPVGIITAMLGGPFFLWLLVRGD